MARVALATMLVAASGVLIAQLLERLSHVNPGFQSERLLTLRDADPKVDTCSATGGRCVGVSSRRSSIAFVPYRD